MALIKCEDCGKEISDKSDKCIHCGCPISNKVNSNGKSKIKYDIKDWEELSDDEINRVRHYRKINGEEFTDLAITGVVFLLFSFICFILLILYICGVIENLELFGISLIGVFAFSAIGGFIIVKDEKEWYERNKERVYKDKYLPLI